MNKHIKANLLMILCFTISCMWMTKVQAQDPHFSQYFASPMTVNPSFIGKDVAEWRASINFRTQWWGSLSSPFTTTTVSLEKRIALAKSNSDYMAVGLMLLSDQSNSGLLKNNYLTGGFAYNKSLDGAGDEQVGAGLSFTYANRLLDQSKFQFQSQFGSMGFQRESPSNDAVIVSKNNYFEVNAGANYSKNNKTNGYRIGVGYFHASKPKVGAFTTSQYSVDPRLNVQASGWFVLPSKHEIHISTNSEFQGGFQIYTVGGLFKVKIEGDDTLESLNVGCFKRFGDAVYPYVGLESKNWIASISYDAVTSDLKSNYNSVQSLELSLVWQFVTKKGLAKPNGKTILY
jgi:type IX secretion system PorP/SprF family membrane protein